MVFFNTPDMNISGFLGTSLSLGLLITSISSLMLGIFVLSKGYKEKLKLFWFILSFFVWAWAFFLYLCCIAKDYHRALLFVRIANYSGIFISASLVLFTEEFIRKPNRIISKVSAYVALIIFIFSIVFPRAFIPSLSPKVSFKMFPDSGIIYYFITLYFVFTWSYSMFILYKSLKAAYGIKREQAKYILISMIISVIIALTTFLPMFNINLFPFGNLFVFFYVVLTTFAIIRYRTFEIDTVIHRTLLWMLTSSSIVVPVGILLYFARPWLTQLNWLQLTLVTTVLFYLYLIYYQAMQPKIDHLFRRRKYDYYLVLAEIGQKIGTELDINDVISRLFKELKKILYIRNGLVLVQQLGQEDYTEAGSIGYDRLQDAPQDRQGGVLYTSKLSQWLNKHKKALEREQVEVNPQYESIKQEALAWLKQNMAELLIPILMEDKINGLIGIGKKENLRSYTAKDIELLEKMGRQLGVTINNSLHHEDIMEKEILEYQKQALEETNKELDDFTYTVSHDLKEPLRAIDAFSKYVMDDYQDKIGEEGRHYLERVRANAERMKKLIEDLLEISRIKRKGSTIEEVDTEEIMAEVKMRLEYAINQKSVEVIIKDKLPRIFCDRVRLTEVFLNLISNAIKYNNKPKPIIEVGYNNKEDFHEFYVKDNGIGIQEEYFDKIFEIFQRLGKREDTEGTGAGLTIVKTIIQMHKGKIWLESKLGEGTTFYFTVPKAKSTILGKDLTGDILLEKALGREEQQRISSLNKGGQDDGRN
jgi:signal transduction histidine kinase